jgi:hypothetical protein
VLQATTPKFGTHAANRIFNTRNEEWIVTCFILPAYFSTEHVWSIYTAHSRIDVYKEMYLTT